MRLLRANELPCLVGALVTTRWLLLRRRVGHNAAAVGVAAPEATDSPLRILTNAPTASKEALAPQVGGQGGDLAGGDGAGVGRLSLMEQHHRVQVYRIAKADATFS